MKQSFAVLTAIAALCLPSLVFAGEAKIVKDDNIDGVYRSDIADLGYINPQRPKVKYFEIHATNDILVDPKAEYSSEGTEITNDDKIKKPVFLGEGPQSIVTPESFPDTSDVFLGKVSNLSTKVSDFVDHVKNAASSLYTDLKDLIQANSTVPPSQNGPEIGNILTVPGKEQKFKWTNIGTYTQYSSENTVPGSIKSGIFFRYPQPSTGSYNEPMWIAYDGTDIYMAKTNQWYGYPYIQLWKLLGNWVADPADWEAPPSVINYDSLKPALESASSEVSEEISDALKDMPASKVDTDGQVLTAAEIKSLLAQNTAAVAKAAADAAAAVAAANPGDAAAQIAAGQAALEAAKTAAEAAAQEGEEVGDEEETFTGINPEGFTEGYQATEYNFDIPGRFDSFLNNVKSSGLFSFSSGFFNSIPGGGSPVFTINGGQTFGSHSIDFSETMTTGLAVLKSILMACFGFLSIRAIIMKR